MKKILIILICFICLTCGVSAQSKRILKRDLPENAIELLDRFYINKLMVCKKYGKFRDVEYQVTLETGTKIEFDRKGNFKSINCGNNDFVPWPLIPYEILNFLIEQFGSYGIIEYNIDERGTRFEEHEIELANGQEISIRGRYKCNY